MGGLSLKTCFHAVEDAVAAWGPTDYMRHVQHVSETDTCMNFNVVFSKPTPSVPIPEHVANVAIAVTEAADESLALTYTVEGELQLRRVRDEPLQHRWLDRVIERKQKVAELSAGFARTGRLAEARAFVPGEYEVSAKLQESADRELAASAEAAFESTLDALDATLAADEAESPEKLEETLRTIFVEADTNQDGTLSREELGALMLSAELKLKPDDVAVLFERVDVDGDGRLKYSEFVPLAVEVVQALRLRALNAQVQRQRRSEAEMCARLTLHGYTREALTEQLVASFKAFDANGDGSLSRDEFATCLQELRLGATKLTPLEVNKVLAQADANADGVIEYAEFAPLAFDLMVDALSLGFMSHEHPQLEAYLVQIFAAHDADSTGLVSRDALNRALNAADLVRLTPVQVLTVTASAVDDGRGVDYARFAVEAAALIGSMKSAAKERQRAAAQAAVVTLVEERKRAAFENLIARCFEQHDADRSGELEMAEFRKALDESRIGLTQHQKLLLYLKADADHDGKIDYNEFVKVAYEFLEESASEDRAEMMIAPESSKKSPAASSISNVVVVRQLVEDLAAERGAEKLGVGVIIGALNAESGLAEDEIVGALVKRLSSDAEREVGWDELYENIVQISGEVDAAKEPK